MGRVFGVAWAVLLGVTMIAGCASDDDDDEFAERFCAVFAPCCAKAGMNGDQSSCRMLYGSAQEAIGEVIQHVKAMEG